MTNEPDWNILPDAEAVAQHACEQIIQKAERAIIERGIFRIVLAGGSTPERTYELLSAQVSGWSHWEVFFGDERCLPANHPDRNSSMAQMSLFDKVAINPVSIYPIPAELGALQAAAFYQGCLEQLPPFDVVLLGMGEDGHTASIFPGSSWQNKASVYDVSDSPKPPADRVTLSAQALGNTRKLLYLITGSSKSDAIKQWQSGIELPVNIIPAQFEAEVLIDKEAYSDG